MPQMQPSRAPATLRCYAALTSLEFVITATLYLAGSPRDHVVLAIAFMSLGGLLWVVLFRTLLRGSRLAWVIALITALASTPHQGGRTAQVLLLGAFVAAPLLLLLWPSTIRFIWRPSMAAASPRGQTQISA